MGLGEQGIEVQFKTLCRDFHLLHSVQAVSRADPVFCQVGTGALTPGVKLQGTCSWSHISSADTVKVSWHFLTNAWKSNANFYLAWRHVCNGLWGYVTTNVIYHKIRKSCWVVGETSPIIIINNTVVTKVTKKDCFGIWLFFRTLLTRPFARKLMFARKLWMMELINYRWQDVTAKLFGSYCFNLTWTCDHEWHKSKYFHRNMSFYDVNVRLATKLLLTSQYKLNFLILLPSAGPDIKP